MFITHFKFCLGSLVLILVFLSLGQISFETIHSADAIRSIGEQGELVYKSLITLFILLFGVSADWYVYRVKQRARETQLEIYRATVWASHHVQNNFLNKLYLIQHQAQLQGEFTEAMSENMGKMIQDAAGQLQELSRVEPVTPETIRNSVSP